MSSFLLFWTRSLSCLNVLLVCDCGFPWVFSQSCFYELFFFLHIVIDHLFLLIWRHYNEGSSFLPLPFQVTYSKEILVMVGGAQYCFFSWITYQLQSFFTSFCMLCSKVHPGFLVPIILVICLLSLLPGSMLGFYGH